MTPPDPGSPATTHVAFIRAGVEVASAEVPGHLLELDVPTSVEVRRQPGGDVHLVESTEPWAECCGRLPLPWLGRTGPGVTVLDVPAAPPFTDFDVRAMWIARNRLTASRRPPTSGHADWSRIQHLLGTAVDWQSLATAVTAGSALLASWPSRPVPTVRWLPIDRAGGRVLVGATERSRRSHSAPATAAGAPAVTARRAVTPQERTLHALSAVAALLADRLAKVPGLAQQPDLRHRLVGLFQEVGQRAKPLRPVADPPPSAWPGPLAATYGACLRALSAVEVLGAGTDASPLSEVWELYQAWCAERVRYAISDQLGPSEKVPATGTCIGRWHDGTATVELHYEPVIPTGTNTVRILGTDFVAAVGELRPDLFLVRASLQATTALALDAKKRSAPMKWDDLTANASKYLWGIRRSGHPDQVPAISGAVMLTPAGGPASGLPSGLGDAFLAHPGAGIGPHLGPSLLAVLRGDQPADPKTWHDTWV
jgi:hypothetical protein